MGVEAGSHLAVEVEGLFEVFAEVDAVKKGQSQLADLVARYVLDERQNNVHDHRVGDSFLSFEKSLHDAAAELALVA